jgi:hypothetical protein
VDGIDIIAHSLAKWIQNAAPMHRQIYRNSIRSVTAQSCHDVKKRAFREIYLSSLKLLKIMFWLALNRRREEVGQDKVKSNDYAPEFNFIGLSCDYKV